MKRTCLAVLSAALLATASACSNTSPLDPVIAASGSGGGTTATRIIALTGDMNFGKVPVGTTVTKEFTITNSGNGSMTITGLAAAGATTGATAAYTTTFTGANLPAGSSQQVKVTFAPTVSRVYAMTIAANGNQTSGTATIDVTGTGSVDHLPLFTQSGTGNLAFTMPSHVSLVRVTGHFDGKGETSNFVVFQGGLLVINELLRTADYDNIVLFNGGGAIEVALSPSITWTFTEVR